MLVVVFYFCVVVILYTLSRFKLCICIGIEDIVSATFTCAIHLPRTSFFKCIALKQKFLLKKCITVDISTPCLLLRFINFTICEA